MLHHRAIYWDDCAAVHMYIYYALHNLFRGLCTAWTVLPLLVFFTRSVFFSVLSGVLGFLLKIWFFFTLVKFL